MTRKELNHNIRALAHGTLGLTEEEYRLIVYNVYQKSEGHITRCDDEHANLVMLHLRQMRPVGQHAMLSNGNERQHKMIPRLMEILGWDWRRTAEFCLQVTGKKNTRQCDAVELSKLIRGMVAVIDSYLKKGRIRMTEAERSEYERHVRQQRGSAGAEQQGCPVLKNDDGINSGEKRYEDLPF
ncbi:MAG: hypothetical protein EPO24_15895 [Bacteroidetes bacterium]|nr:MAG: hypothetical protein EPO24_15895 [Bacteroidota bacterium]